MNYMILVIKDKETVDVDYTVEHPNEDYLRQLTEIHEADYCDVSRTEDGQ